jgi:hypothetical protein
MSNNRLWSARISKKMLFTRLPGNATMPERGLKLFTDVAADYTNADAPDNTAGLKNYVAVPALPVGSALQQQVIQNAAGGNLAGAVDASGRPTSNRLNIMGDVIDSSPSVLEYKMSDKILAGLGQHPALSVAGGNRFRLILVGTNQGWLHAFGELTTVTTVFDMSGTQQEIVKGAVDELWSFMPTDFLAHLDTVFGPSAGNNPHRFMVDGTPSIYFLDLPPATGGSGDGVLDTAAASLERGIAIIGLRKGGRSYYALDIRDPFNPTLKWSLVPDEAALLPAARNLSSMSTASLQTLIASMGYSTCTPGIGRVSFTQGGVTKLRDAVFLGGGFSVPQVEAKFLDGGGNTTLLGRSALAVDVNTGEILAAADMTSLPGVVTTLGPPATPSQCSVGSIPAGLVPFEFILNSGMAQRAYFLDFKGGLWSWGSKALADATMTGYVNYRIDNSDLAKWTTDGTTAGTVGIRKVFKDGTGFNSLYTTLPAPWRVGFFPGKGKNAGDAAPAAVGIAIESGDRNNPLDYNYAVGTAPTQHRLTVVFDRQDSHNWGLDTKNGPDQGILSTSTYLKDFSNTTVSTDPKCGVAVWEDITPGCPGFYLSPSAGSPFFGYYVNFPAAGPKFVPKGINSPMVVANSLFYTYFNPTKADPCTGGQGISYTSEIADVISPVVTDTRAGIVSPSGAKFSWSGVSSDYVAFGTRGVIQGGTVPLTNPVPGGVQTTMQLKTIPGNPKERYPKARVWRTVH